MLGLPSSPDRLMLHQSKIPNDVLINSSFVLYIHDFPDYKSINLYVSGPKMALSSPTFEYPLETTNFFHEK